MLFLFTGYSKQDLSQLGVDARHCAVLDSACSSTVCGKVWLDEYVKRLDVEDRETVTKTEGKKVFKFDSNIPLLLSRTAMKTAGAKVDLANDRATIFGQDVAHNILGALLFSHRQG